MSSAAPGSPAAPPLVASISGTPTAEEVAAIIAAIELSWPRPVSATEPSREGERWRFSRRWWARPVADRRDRPF